MKTVVVMGMLVGATLSASDAAWAECELTGIERHVSEVEHQIRMLSLEMTNIQFSSHKSETLSLMEQTRMNFDVGHEVRMLGIQVKQLLNIEQSRECRSYWFWQAKPDYCQSLQ